MSDPSPHGRCRSDRGQVLPVVALVLLAAIGAVVLLAALAPIVVDRARASAAADAAALAGTTGGRAVAASVASANGGVLEGFRRSGADRIEVTVRVGSARADAAAELVGARWVWPAGGPPDP